MAPTLSECQLVAVVAVVASEFPASLLLLRAPVERERP